MNVFTAILNLTVGNGTTPEAFSPQRAERLWLAIAVSTLWMLMLGGDSGMNWVWVPGS